MRVGNRPARPARRAGAAGGGVFTETTERADRSALILYRARLAALQSRQGAMEVAEEPMEAVDHLPEGLLFIRRQRPAQSQDIAHLDCPLPSRPRRESARFSFPLVQLILAPHVFGRPFTI